MPPPPLFSSKLDFQKKFPLWEPLFDCISDSLQRDWALLDPTAIEASLTYAQSNKKKRILTNLLLEELPQTIPPELKEYFENNHLFIPPCIQKKSINVQKNSVTFIYDKNDPISVILNALKNNESIQSICTTDSSHNEFSKAYNSERLILATKDPNWILFSYLLAHHYKKKIFIWNELYGSPFRYLGFGITPEVDVVQKETLREKFEVILHHDTLPLQNNSFLEKYLDLIENKKFEIFHSEFYKQISHQLFKNPVNPNNPSYSFSKLYIHRVLNQNYIFKEINELLKFLENLDRSEYKTTSSGYQAAMSYFNPQWFSLFDKNDREKHKSHAKNCLQLLAWDTSKNQDHERSYIYKVFWNLYFNNTACIDNEMHSMKEQFGKIDHFPTYVSYFLWGYGDLNKAKQLIPLEAIKDIADIDTLHLCATMQAILGFKEASCKTLHRVITMDKDYLKKKDKRFYKWMHQAMFLRALGKKDQAQKMLEIAQEEDPNFKEKLKLYEKISLESEFESREFFLQNLC